MKCPHEWVPAGVPSLVELREMRRHVSCAQPKKLACVLDGCGSTVVVQCHSTRASRCKYCAGQYRQRVKRAARSGIVLGRSGLFLTFTAPGAGGCASWCGCTPAGFDLAAWNAGAVARWNRLAQSIARELGKLRPAVVKVDSLGRKYRTYPPVPVEYFRATEVQTRGALHFHVLLRARDGSPVALSKSLLRRLAIKHGFGHAVDVQVLATVCQERRGCPCAGCRARYCAKYVSKAVDLRSEVPWPRRQAWEVRESSGAYRLRVSQAWRKGHSGACACSGCSVRVVTIKRASYRAWTASRGWGESMRAIKAAQAHWVAVLAQLGPERDVRENVCNLWSPAATVPAAARWAPARPDKIGSPPTDDELAGLLAGVAAGELSQVPVTVPA